MFQAHFYQSAHWNICTLLNLMSLFLVRTLKIFFLLSLILTNTMLQLQEGYGIGDDEYSIAYDGCRQLVWYNARSQAQCEGQWTPGDILGCLLDLEKPIVKFYINGQLIVSTVQLFNHTKLVYHYSITLR